MIRPAIDTDLDGHTLYLNGLDDEERKLVAQAVATDGGVPHRAGLGEPDRHSGRVRADAGLPR